VAAPWRDKDQFKARVREWSNKLGVHARTLAVRPMRNKWASWSLGDYERAESRLRTKAAMLFGQNRR
jgi:predicted metal-dependent hydrolase